MRKLVPLRIVQRCNKKEKEKENGYEEFENLG